jgi:hypothetical protein
MMLFAGSATLTRDSKKSSVNVSTLSLDFGEKLTDLVTVISEIDLTLRLQAAGYIVRVSMIASRCKEWFREGVSLTQWDYVANLEKSDIRKLSSRCVRC